MTYKNVDKKEISTTALSDDERLGNILLGIACLDDPSWSQGDARNVGAKARELLCPARATAVAAERPTVPDEPRYPCAKCGKLRTCAEGGNVLTTCEGLGFNCDGTVDGMKAG
jgi:hypothetical protein